MAGFVSSFSHFWSLLWVSGFAPDFERPWTRRSIGSMGSSHCPLGVCGCKLDKSDRSPRGYVSSAQTFFYPAAAGTGIPTGAFGGERAGVVFAVRIVCLGVEVGWRRVALRFKSSTRGRFIGRWAWGARGIALRRWAVRIRIRFDRSRGAARRGTKGIYSEAGKKFSELRDPCPLVWGASRREFRSVDLFHDAKHLLWGS